MIISSVPGKSFIQDAPVPRGSAAHGGEDVAIYARGPMAHLFSGQHEEHYIPHAAGYASCIGWNTDFCDSNPPPPEQ
jgi:alkaline phosphatase